MIAGFTGNIMSRSESTDINGNLSYQQSELALDVDGNPLGISTSRLKAASVSSEVVTQSYFGRTETTSTPGVTGLMTYSYDALGRVIHTRDPRHIGDSDTVYFANSNQVDFTRNAKDEKTSYTYFGNGVLGAGRVSQTTLPDSSIVNQTYNAHGLPVATWGSQTYTRHYTYNGYDEMTELRTWQTDPEGDFTDLTEAQVTTWTYHEGTGLLLSKRDADDKGCDYFYDTADRLAKRESARLGDDDTDPIQTEYDYTEWGQLETIDYTNDPAATADLGYSYDRIGRLLNVTQGGSNHATYTYDPSDLRLLTERNSRNLNPTRFLTRKRDTFLRSTGYTLGSLNDPDRSRYITDKRESAQWFHHILLHL